MSADQARSQHLVETLVVAHLVHEVKPGDHDEVSGSDAQPEDRTVLARKLHEGLYGGIRPSDVEEVAQHGISGRLRDGLVGGPLGGHSGLLRYRGLLCMRRNCTVKLCLSPSDASAVCTLYLREVIAHPLNELVVLYRPEPRAFRIPRNRLI